MTNFPLSKELVIIQVDDHTKMRLTSQLIIEISRVLQKLITDFNGSIISASFVLSAAGNYSLALLNQYL